MTPQVLMDKLLKSAAGGRLGHFYLLQGRGGSDGEAQVSWAKTFVRRHWTEVEKRQHIPHDIMNDSDLLWLKPWDEEKEDWRGEYLVADLKPLTTFLGYRSLGGQKRFVVLEQIHRLSDTVANRMLKILEEPMGDVTYLGLNPQGTKLMPTIESRAISHALSWPTSTHSTSLIDELKEKFKGDYTLVRFMEEAKKSWSLAELLPQLLTFEQNNDGPVALKQELLTIVRGWQNAQTFNQPTGPQLQSLFIYLVQRFRNVR